MDQNYKLGMNKTLVIIAYVLGFVIPLVSVIIAYIGRMEVKENKLAFEHFTYTIISFWWYIGICILSAILIPMGLGYVLLIGIWIWYWYRLIKGLIRICNNRGLEE